MQRCVICERRPANGGGFCIHCGEKLSAEKRKTLARTLPRYFITYQGHVVGLYRAVDGSKLVARLLGRSPDRLPKRKTLNLNTYLEGFTRDRIKAFKACVLSLANN